MINSELNRLLELERFVADGLSNSTGIMKYRKEYQSLKAKLEESLNKTKLFDSLLVENQTILDTISQVKITNQILSDELGKTKTDLHIMNEQEVDLKERIDTDFQTIKSLIEEKDKIIMENCILSDDLTALQSFFTMNDVDNLEELDKSYNDLKQKLEKIESRKIIKFLTTIRHDLKKHHGLTIGGLDSNIEFFVEILKEEKIESS